MQKIKFTYKTPDSDRRHYIDEHDVLVLLTRLPSDTWERLKVVHFNDNSRGGHVYGYTTTRGRKEISICALPPRFSLKWARAAGVPERFGAISGTQWPTLAIRRYLLYNTFLHEIGHLQIVLPDKSNPRRKFADETIAQMFANQWRKTLWKKKFDHPDPVHNAPTQDENDALKNNWLKAHQLFKKGLNLENACKYENAIQNYNQAIELYPNHTNALENLGILLYNKNRKFTNIVELKQAEDILKNALSKDRLLPLAGRYINKIQESLNNESNELKKHEK